MRAMLPGYTILAKNLLSEELPVARDSDPTPICLACGFCCDDTLFELATAKGNDSVESLVQIGLRALTNDAGVATGFPLPCPNFIGMQCSVYENRPTVCRTFRCKLLKDVQRGTYSVPEARQIALSTRALRDQLAPELDSMYRDAGVAGEGSSVISRLAAMVPLLTGQTDEFREKHGASFMVGMSLLIRLRSYFNPVKKTPKETSQPRD